MTIYSFDGALRARKEAHSFEVAPGKKVALWRPVAWVAVGYFAVAVLVFMIIERFIPFVAMFDLVMATEASWVLYYALIPAGVVWFSMNAELDGRHPHRWAISTPAWIASPRRTLAGRSIPLAGTKISYAGRVRVHWDINAPRLYSGWVRGGKVSSTVPVRFSHALTHRRPVISPDGDGVILSDYEVDRLEVRP